MEKRPDAMRESVMAQAIWLTMTNGIFIDGTELAQTYGLSHVTLTYRNGVVTVSRVEVRIRGRGDGSRFMEALTKEADRRGVTLALTPDSSFGASSVRRLGRFYRRFGFRDNKGRHADLRICESMIRKPASSPALGGCAFLFMA